MSSLKIVRPFLADKVISAEPKPRGVTEFVLGDPDGRTLSINATRKAAGELASMVALLGRTAEDQPSGPTLEPTAPRLVRAGVHPATGEPVLELSFAPGTSMQLRLTPEMLDALRRVADAVEKDMNAPEARH